ncbi:plasmodesmata-located protein 6 [Vigna unguiculata]|uniref:plasmodesmata-located protein 6 n=1 Tax=Vigna unguiculata TaxID=3917 RepID=UPI001015EC6F|nr:plasmodesmata-located protein 6 [Vigna unguiculata]
MPNPTMHHLLLRFLFLFSALATPSSAAIDTFIFGGCSQPKYTPGSPYESTVNSLLTSLISSASFANYNNFTLAAASSDTVYGLFQCRGDLNNDQCSRCVARAVTQLGTLCYASCGGALQLEGCFVKYDNATFVGVEDKTVVTKKCGPSVGLTSDALTRRDAVLAYLQTPDGTSKTFRTSGYGDFQGVAQCTGDLSPTECQDCLSAAIQRLKTDCGPSPWAEMYLAKCYARYSQGGSHSRPNNNDDSNHNDDEIEKTLAILIGLIAGVALIIVFLSFLSKVCEKQKGGK